jgi:predicted nucleic acid-binding protein
VSTVYLDACCIGRLEDDPSQERIRLEADAIEHIFAAIAEGRLRWISGHALGAEIDLTPDPDRRRRARILLTRCHEWVPLTEPVKHRAQELQTMGFGAMDALHLASAEAARVDIFLTTDDRLLRLARRTPSLRWLHVANPLAWLQEVQL